MPPADDNRTNDTTIVARGAVQSANGQSPGPHSSGVGVYLMSQDMGRLAGRGLGDRSDVLNLDPRDPRSTCRQRRGQLQRQRSVTGLVGCAAQQNA